MKRVGRRRTVEQRVCPGVTLALLSGAPICHHRNIHYHTLIKQERIQIARTQTMNVTRPLVANGAHTRTSPVRLTTTWLGYVRTFVIFDGYEYCRLSQILRTRPATSAKRFLAAHNLLGHSKLHNRRTWHKTTWMLRVTREIRLRRWYAESRNLLYTEIANTGKTSLLLVKNKEAAIYTEISNTNATRTHGFMTLVFRFLVSTPFYMSPATVILRLL